jgi:hypothetical protein
MEGGKKGKAMDTVETLMDPMAGRRAVKAIMAIADSIREAREIPAGHLYAALMHHGCSLATFEQIIGVFTSAKHGKPLVRRVNDLLIWNA